MTTLKILRVNFLEGQLTLLKKVNFFSYFRSIASSTSNLITLTAKMHAILLMYQSKVSRFCSHYP